jgi:23S rRNA (cytidine1920-2'-O)/16S rRNA (cytidine1409-2'-O)-methyltransferase
VVRRQRLDAELVRRGLARSREHAQELVSAGRVSVGGTAATKPATQVDLGAPIVLATADDDPGYASRGAHKLAGALAVFGPAGLDPADRHCLDAGASTGGFTDVLLRAGAASVLAVDVGYGQLAWRLRQNPRVRVLDRTNVRDLTPAVLAGAGPANVVPDDAVHANAVPDDAMPDLVVADLSFISLALVLPALRSVTTRAADFVLMVKPQFEVGRDRLGPGGVVRDPALRSETVATIAARAADLGLGVRGVTASPLPGPSGNVEYFLWLREGAPPLDPDDLARAIEEGPQ